MSRVTLRPPNGPKYDAPSFLALPDDRKSRIRRFFIKPYKRIALIILEQDVIVRLMLLNERIFKNKRLKLRVDDNNVKVVYLLYHRLDLWQVRAAKIARDTVFQFFALPTYMTCPDASSNV